MSHDIQTLITTNQDTYVTCQIPLDMTWLLCFISPRNTPTSAGPNSFNKSLRGFSDPREWKNKAKTDSWERVSMDNTHCIHTHNICTHFSLSLSQTHHKFCQVRKVSIHRMHVETNIVHYWAHAHHNFTNSLIYRQFQEKKYIIVTVYTE